MQKRKLQIFQGITPKAFQTYLYAVFQDVRAQYPRLIVPCAGRFTIPGIARAAGYAPEQIETSDIGLFSSIIGFVLAGKRLAELGVQFRGELAFLSEHETQPTYAGALLYALKWVQVATAKTYYMQEFRRELESNPQHYIALFQAEADTMKTALGGIDYRIRDMFAEIKAADETALLFVNPPGYSKGYDKMFPESDVLTWAAPSIPQFDPKMDNARWKDRFVQGTLPTHSAVRSEDG